MPTKAPDHSRLLQVAVDATRCPVCMSGRPSTARWTGNGARLTCSSCGFVYVLPWPELRKRWPDLDG